MRLFFTYSALLLQQLWPIYYPNRITNLSNHVRPPRKEDHLKAKQGKRLLEEKYAVYTLSLIQQHIHHELYESKLLTKITDIAGVLGSAFTAIFGLAEDHL